MTAAAAAAAGCAAPPTAATGRLLRACRGGGAMPGALGPPRSRLVAVPVLELLKVFVLVLLLVAAGYRRPAAAGNSIAIVAPQHKAVFPAVLRLAAIRSNLQQ